MRPVVVPADYEGAEEVFYLHNGDGPVTLVLDNKGRIFLALGGSSESCSCLWNDQVIEGPLGMLVGVNARIVQFGAKLLAHHACVSMSILDDWARLCQRLPPLESECDDPLQELTQIVEERAARARTHESYTAWSVDPLIRDRWSGSPNEKHFILDLLNALLGPTLLKCLCTYMGLDPPRPPSLKTLGLSEAAPASEVLSRATPPATKKSKALTIAGDDAKGHRSLTLFFKARPK